MNERIWLSSYPPGVPETVDPGEYHSLVEPFEKFCQEYANNVAFSNFGVPLTFAQMEQKSRYFAAFLQQHLGVQKGDRVALMMPNSLQFPIAVFGVLRVGAVVVNVNPLYTPPELIHQMSDSETQTIIVMENFAHTLEKALPNTPIKNVIITQMGDLLGTVKGCVMNVIIKYVKKIVPRYHLPTAITFKQVIKRGKSLHLQPVSLNHDDIAFLQYTGGTTGIAKGAILTHRNMLANVMQILAWVKDGLHPQKDVVLGALPLYHIFSLTICCLCFLATGSECLLITNPRDLTGLIKILHQKAPTIFIGLNTLFNALLHHKDFHQIDFSRLHLTVAGGMSTQKVVADRWQAATGMPIIEGYGLTEASPVVCVNPITQTQFNNSIGLPLPGTDVDLRDEQGHSVPIGEVGELWIRGPQVMKGYWKHPEETQAAIQEGWLKTGDMARMDDRGFLYIVDRKKDMVLVSGFNVFPNEVEEVIARHPSVAEVAVIGVPSEETGETVKAFIVLKKNQQLTSDEVVAFCHESLTNYKVPKKIEFRDELPKTNVGKISRRVLKDEQLDRQPITSQT